MRLSELHQVLSRDEWEQLADKAQTDSGYLWQCATRWRGKRPSLDLMARLVEVEPRLTLQELVAEFTEAAA